MIILLRSTLAVAVLACGLCSLPVEASLSKQMPLQLALQAKAHSQILVAKGSSTSRSSAARRTSKPQSFSPALSKPAGTTSSTSRTRNTCTAEESIAIRMASGALRQQLLQQNPECRIEVFGD